MEDESFPRDPSGLTTFTNAFRGHPALQEFVWIDYEAGLEAAQGVTTDVVLQTFLECPNLRRVSIITKCASTDAMKNLLQLQRDTDLHLVLEFDQWLAVTDEIRLRRCNVQTLTLQMLKTTRTEATEAVEAVASALRVYRIDSLVLRMVNGFKDEAEVALAEALTVNKTLRKIDLNNEVVFAEDPFSNQAFSTMLRGNTSIKLELPPIHSIGGDLRLLQSCVQMAIE
jgi:hypothetical protein